MIRLKVFDVADKKRSKRSSIPIWPGPVSVSLNADAKNLVPINPQVGYELVGIVRASILACNRSNVAFYVPSGGGAPSSA